MCVRAWRSRGAKHPTIIMIKKHSGGYNLMRIIITFHYTYTRWRHSNEMHFVPSSNSSSSSLFRCPNTTLISNNINDYMRINNSLDESCDVDDNYRKKKPQKKLYNDQHFLSPENALQMGNMRKVMNEKKKHQPSEICNRIRGKLHITWNVLDQCLQ